jgi:hypothetical protein
MNQENPDREVRESPGFSRGEHVNDATPRAWCEDSNSRPPDYDAKAGDRLGEHKAIGGVSREAAYSLDVTAQAAPRERTRNHG